MVKNLTQDSSAPYHACSDAGITTGGNLTFMLPMDITTVGDYQVQASVPGVPCLALVASPSAAARPTNAKLSAACSNYTLAASMQSLRLFT